MDPDTAVALIGFAFVMSISPGPGNFLLLTSGANHGFVRSLPLLLGISSGFLTMVFCVGIGLGQVMQQVPEIQTGLRLLCGGYVLWLAVRIARSRALGNTDSQSMTRPVSFIQAALLQLLNPKAWAVALIVTVTYTTPEAYMPSLLLMITIFALVNIPTISIWALSGAALRRALATGNRIVWFNIAMALLLVGSMIPVLLGD